MKLEIYKNKKTKLFTIKHPNYGRCQYTTWSMLKAFYKREYGIQLPSFKTLDFKYIDIMEVEECAIMNINKQ